VLVADPPCSLFLITWRNIQKVGQDSLYVHSVNVEYIRDNVLGTYGGDYEDVF